MKFTLVDYLTDAKKSLAFLINCKITDEKIYCGLAAFRGGLSGEVTLIDGKNNYKVLVPEEVVNEHTWVTFVDSMDKCEIQRLKAAAIDT